MAESAGQGRLALYAADALGRRDRLTVETHLTLCGGCREDLVELVASHAFLERHCDAIDGGAVEPPPTLRGRVLAAARAQRPSGYADWCLVEPLRPSSS